MPNADPNIIQDPKRLAVLHRLELLDSPSEEAFDRLTRLASKIVNAPVSLVSLVDADRQFFKSFLGLGKPWSVRRETPLSHSFCQHVVAENAPLIIEDARTHPLVFDNLAIPDLNVISYLGMPLTMTDGTGLGSFCVIDSKPRQWTADEIEIIRELALSAMTEIELRAELLAHQETEARLRVTLGELEQKNQKLARVTGFVEMTIDTLFSVIQHDATKPELLTYLTQAKYELERQSSPMTGPLTPPKTQESAA